MQAYTIYCVQDARGGLKDKPSAGIDPYHTMYSMAGCSVGQHLSDYENLYSGTENCKNFTKQFDGNYSEEETKAKTSLLGGVENNKLRRMNSIFNGRFDYVEKARAYFREQDKANT